MSECTCHKNYTLDTLIPQVGVITDIHEETPDVKTFCVTAPDGGKLFEHMPGQCAMVCAPGVKMCIRDRTNPTKKVTKQREKLTQSHTPMKGVFYEQQNYHYRSWRLCCL